MRYITSQVEHTSLSDVLRILFLRSQHIAILIGKQLEPLLQAEEPLFNLLEILVTLVDQLD
jgi:hypothetical protein